MDTFNFLGLTLNRHLDWKDHIQTVSNKISSTLGVLNKLKNYVPQKALKLIYCSLILPRLYYCNLLWGYKPNRLIQLQKKAVHIVCKDKYNAHTDPLFKSQGMLSIADIHTSKKLCFYYKFEKDKVPAYFWSYMFTANANNRIRNKDPYQPLTAKTTVFSETIRFSLPHLLKSTPPNIKSKVITHSYNGFKKYVKTFFLSKYRELYETGML